MRQMLALRGYDPTIVTAAIMASVVPPLTDVMNDAVRHAFAREPLVVGPGLKTGMAVLYENPRDVGADRICNAVAAYDRIRAGVIVVDFGTATIFDCISPKGEYIGGVIVPGIQVSLDGLLARAAKLARIEIAEPPRIVGRNTTHALQSGIIHGYSTLVDGMVEKIEGELGFPCSIIATGGLIQHILKHTHKIQTVDPFLTLNGLRILHERNILAESDAPSRSRSRAPR
jgi:type III pantothenate kinase